MPEPGGPQQGQQIEDMDTLKKDADIAPNLQGQSQGKPAARDRYADPDKQAQEDAHDEEVAQDEEDHRDERDALENEIDDDGGNDEASEKQSGQMLENPTKSDRD